MKLVSAKEAELENQDDEDGDAKNAMPKIIVSIRGHDTPMQMHMNTAALENKINAVQIIKGVSTTLGPLFGDYVEPVAQLLVTELMHCQISTAVRKVATKTLAVLLMCAKDQEQMKQLFTLYLPGFASSMKVYLERLDFTTVKWLTLELSRCVKHFYNFKGQQWLSEQYLCEMLDMLSKIVRTVQLDTDERLS
jgi:hypothetical protein